MQRWRETIRIGLLGLLLVAIVLVPGVRAHPPMSLTSDFVPRISAIWVQLTSTPWAASRSHHHVVTVTDRQAEPASGHGAGGESGTCGSVCCWYAFGVPAAPAPLAGPAPAMTVRLARMPETLPVGLARAPTVPPPKQG